MPNYQNSIKKASHTNVDDFTKLGHVLNLTENP